MALNIKLPSLFIGYLLASKAEKILIDNLISSTDLSFVNGISDADGWEVFSYKSKEPLMNEDEFDIPGPYLYPLLCRRSGLRALFLCKSRQIIDHLRSNIFATIFKPNLLPIRFAVHDMVSDIASKPKGYVLTSVHARVDAYGNNLKSTSFYGDDIGEATIFRENIDLLSCFSCGIKEASKNYELIRLSAEGIVSFRLHNFRELPDIEKLLRYVADNGYYVFPEGYLDYHKKELK